MHPHRFTIPFHSDELSLVESAAIYNAPDDDDAELIAKHCVFEQDDAEIFERLEARGVTVHPRVETGDFDRALIFLGKHSDFNKAMIGRAWRMVREGGDILIEGAKTDGVDSLIRGLRGIGLTPYVEPKSHGKIAWFTRAQNTVGNIDAWAGDDATFENEDGYTVAAGIFSPQKIDKGTAFLLEHMNMALKGEVADFGGGYGVITREILMRNPEIEALDFYEVSYRACECAKVNVTDSRAHVHWLSVDKAAREHFKTIISNPPFHKGREGDPRIGQSFIDAAARSLRARGAFYMVANKHLPYERHLRMRFGQVEVIAENNAYKLFKATRPNGKGL